MTYAKLKDGTVVESSTFDVGEDLFVVSEDGEKTLAPNGEHELSLRDEEGNEVLFKVITEDGKIVERENVELEDVKVEDIPQAGNEDKENVMDTPAGSVEKGTMKAAEVDEVADEMPQTDGEPLAPVDSEEEMKKYEKMAIRIEELEKKIAKMEEVLVIKKEDEEEEEEEMMEEEELPKLDGAPVEEMKFAAELNKKNYGKKVGNSQSAFLSKLYK